MKIKVVFDFDERDRRALAAQHGDRKPAPHASIKSWIASQIEAIMWDVRDEYDKSGDMRRDFKG